jgi:two-component system, cell cycle sensor histidine kinase and response regulator CckA
METTDETLQAIFDQAAVGIAQIGLDGAWLRVNDRYCQMLGYSLAELRTKNIWDITHPDDCDEVSKGRRQLLEGAISAHSMEKRYIRKDGTVFWGRLNRSLVRDHGNQPKFFVAVLEDINKRKQAEAALRESQERYKEMFDTTSDCIFLVDVTADARFQWARFNPAAEKVAGLSNAELSGKFVDDMFTEQLANNVITHYRRCVEAGEPIQYEEELLLPGGQGHFLTNLIPVRDADGRIYRLVGIARDITAQKRSEEGLRLSQQRLELAQEAGGIGIWDSDMVTGESHCSSGYGPLYGLPSGDLAPTPERWFELLYPEDRDRIREEVDRAIQGTDCFTLEFRVVWPDGTIHWLYGKGQVLRDSQGKPVRMVGVNMDISERKHAEAAVRESEERFRKMADTAPVMIWVSGRDKLCTFFNAAWLAFTGRTMEQELGNGWSQGVHSEDLDPCIAIYSSSFDAHRAFRMEYRLRRADGQYRWVLDNGVPRFEPGGSFAGYIGSCIDITDLKRTLEETLARQKLEDLGVLAGGIAHDFNNLLGSVLAETELVEADLAAGLSPHEELARIKTVAIRGAEIVRELMIYAGQDQAGVFESVDLSRLMVEMLELIKVSISKHAVLKSNLGQDLPLVWGNAPQIRQVLMNLVINASEAIGEKRGMIEIATSLGTGGASSAGDYVHLEVSDNGCGMTEETKAKIFDPFFTTKFVGRGLGLAVVHGIVRAHGGAIEIESAPSQGATFRVSLPCASAAQNAIRPSAAERSQVPARSVGTVLVVEDEEVLRLAVSKALRNRGFAVMEAQDGSVAIGLMRVHSDDIDVMLLDFTLPGTSSREVFEESQRLRPNMKVVLSSAYDRKTVAASFLGLRVTQFIRKPFQLDDLAGTLREALSS